jgi:hypothetical protein
MWKRMVEIMRMLLLALEVYQMASRRLHEIRIKGVHDSYAEQHRDDSMEAFGRALDDYVDRRIGEALKKEGFNPKGNEFI